MKNGELKNLIISGAPNYNFKGEIIGSIGVHLDVTTQKKLEKQKEQLLNKLEKQNQRLNDYAQIVTHDLKSPLRSIHSLITWIKEDDKNVDPTTKEYLNLIETKVEKMDHLIQGVYTYSKVDEEDSITEVVNVYLIIENLITTLDIPEHIKIKINKNLPNIKANNFKIQQLFQNILTNAILYNDKNDGFIEINYEKKQKNHLFSIYDNGPGIAEENKEKIFKVFQSFTNHQMSTGIGLSIVKRIVDNYKGKVWIESELTKGTTFFISLPIN
jgi:light-regulated signal transduction histidine kinase (bacteriophytochrome)